MFQRSLMFVSVVTLAYLNVQASCLNKEIKMLTDVINTLRQPSSVLIHVCRKPSEKIKLFHGLNLISKPVRFIDDLDDTENYIKQHLIIVTDLNCNNSKIFLDKANTRKKFRNPYRWIIIGKNDTNMEEMLEEFGDKQFLIDSRVILCIKYIDSFSFYLPYKQLPSSEWKIESFGTWSVEQGLKRSKKMFTELSMRRKNLDSLPIATSLVISTNKTKTDLMTLKNLDIDIATKASFRVLSPIYDFINATCILVYTDNWGYIVNGSYNGMIGQIVNGNAELTGTMLFITIPRLDVLDYLAFPTSSTVRFVFRQPSLSYQNNLFILPFKPNVWFCIFGLAILMILIIFVNARWENIKMEYQDGLNKSILPPNLSDSTLLVVGAFTQQGSFTELKGTLGRVVMFLMFLAFLFLYTSYSANIVALLQSSSNQIKTVADLLNSKLEVGVEDTPYNRYYFTTATDPVKKALYEKKIAPRGSKPNFMTIQDGVKKLQKKPFAFNMFLGGGYKLVEKYFLEHEKCGLQEIEYIEENKPWLACRKNSPMKELYKIGLFRNLEHGINSRENSLIYGKKPTCIVHGGIFASVNMTDFYPALCMLAYGIVLSIVMLFFEIVFWKRFNRRPLAI